MPDSARPLLPWWVALPGAVGAGLLYDLAFPGAGIWPLAFAGIGLALLTLIGRSAGGALLVGYVFGLTFYLVDVDWTGRYLGPIPWIALSALEAAFVAVGALLITLAYRWVPRWSPSAVVARLVWLPALVAGLWVLRETLVGTMPYGGFPWGRAALSQSESPLADLSSWLGLSGLGFVMVFVVASFLEWCRRAQWRAIRGLLPSVLVLVVAAALPAFPTTSAGTLRVGSVQGNGPAGYFDHRAQGDVFRAQLSATAPILDHGMDVLVWPEGSVDADPLGDNTAARVLDGLSRKIDGPLVVNTITAHDDELFNSSLLWRAGDGAVTHYDKRHPVPFGEYIPDRDFYMALAPGLIGLVQRGYSAGTNPPVFDLGKAVAGLAICFDVIYDDLVHEGARDGAELYLFQTNNADFRGTDENLQQLAIARMRAIETGRWVVNISTVGTSQVIDANGRTIDSLPADRAGAMLTTVGLRTGLTPAVVAGETVTLGISLLSIAALVIAGFAARGRGVRAKRVRRSSAGRDEHAGS